MLSYLNLRCNDSINSEGAQKRLICWDIEGTFSPSGPTLSLLCRRIPVVEQCVPHLRVDHPVHPPCRHHGLLLLHDGPHHLEEQRSCKCRGVNTYSIWKGNSRIWQSLSFYSFIDQSDMAVYQILPQWAYQTIFSQVIIQVTIRFLFDSHCWMFNVYS